MYSEHGLDAVIRPVSGLVCQSLIVSSYWRPLAGAEAELLTVLNGPHELVTDAHRVVGVLVLHRVDVAAAEVHVEAGVAQRADLVLLARLGLDELLDVGVVHVEHDHLGRAPRRATGLDRPRARVSAAHERHRPGRRTTAAQQLLR
jgi:hypothetical protein